MLVGVVFGLFAQNLTYQAVIRDNNQQLVTNTAVKATVTITFATGTPTTYEETVVGSTNIHGLLSIEFGGDTLIGRDWTDAKITTTVKSADESVVYVNNLERPVSAVPYALSVNGQSIQNYLTEHNYVDLTKLNDTLSAYSTTAAMEARHYLTSDSAVITTMQGHISTNKTNIQTNAGTISALTTKEQSDSLLLAGRIDALEGAAMDCNKVKECIKDTLSKYTVTDVLNDLLQQLTARLDAQDTKIDSLAHIVDSLSNLTPGGDTTAFTCGTDKVQDTDGNEYNTVQIGTQCWMKENLRTNVDGSVYPKRDNETVTGEDTITYGRLYTWSAMMKGAPSTNYPAGTTEADTIVHGICPAGWHVPSNAEWDTLTRYVFSIDDYKCGDECGTWQAQSDFISCIANALSSSTGWQSPSDCGAGHNSTTLNATGFSAVPAGYCFDGHFYVFGYRAFFWSATQSDVNSAWGRYLSSYFSDVYSGNDSKDIGFSVRCLRDAGVGGGTTPSAPATMSCEDVMECMGDTLGKLNTKIEAQGQTITTQGQTIDSLAHIVDSLSNLTPGGGDEPATFTCGTDKVQDVDGNEYNTVQIANQCWMKENLRTKTHQYGQVWTKTDADSAIYGRYYDWQAAMQIEQGNSTSYTAGDKHRGICPEGWHVPSDAEWTQLTDYVNTAANGYRCNGDGTIANALSSSTGWQSPNDCCAGHNSATLNATGFSAVPAGYCSNGGFGGFGRFAYFWSATQYDGNRARYRRLSSGDFSVRSSYNSKSTGYSVRCLRDAGVGGTPGENETGGTTPSAPATMSCEQVMECMGDTLGKLNTKIEAQGETITTYGHTIDSLAHIVDSLSNLTPGGGDEPATFTCGTDKVQDTDGNEYNTVKIGNQCWMAQNLRTNVGGGVYPKYPSGHTRAGQMVDDSLLYGRLYTWSAMMKGAPSTNYPAGTTEADTIVHGICPAGWHVPSNAEWDTLTRYVFSIDDYKCGDDCGTWQAQSNVSCIANALSSSTGWQSPSDCGAGHNSTTLNATGFSAVPAGSCLGGYFYDFGDYACFWSATQSGGYDAWGRYLRSGASFVISSHDDKDYGFSVRCLRDAGVGGTPGENETGGTTPSAPATMSCEQVMECMGDTLGKLNTKIEAQGETITTYGHTIDSLAHIVDSLSNLTPGGGDEPATFTCGTDKVKDVDNNEYNTVQIGTQCWMKENLRTDVVGGVYPKKNDGQDDLTPDEQVVYGRLYTWAAVMQGAGSTNYPASGSMVQGICPAGWHVPSDAEWTQLTDYVNTAANGYRCNGDGTIANALSSSTGWQSPSDCGAGHNSATLNATGFSAVPAGGCFNGGFSDFGDDAYFWSATQGNGGSAWYRDLYSDDSVVYSNSDPKDNGFSVRCLRD